MDKFDRAAIRRLADDQEHPCVSLFMPTHVAGKAGEQDAIRLKNLVREAESRLTGHWLSAAKARKLLEPVAGLSADTSFWQNRSQGLAVFAGPKLFETFRVDRPLVEHLSVANRFRVRPLLPLIEQDVAYYLLVISENHVAFYAVDGQSIEEIEVPDLPRSLSDTLGEARKPPVLQTHSAMRGVTGKQGAVFHGQGGQADTAGAEQLAFCGEVDTAITKWLGDASRPVLLACVEPLAATYRQKSSCSNLLPELMAGNWDHCGKRELQERSMSIVGTLLAADAAKLAARYQQLVGTPQATDDPVQVIEAALQGRVDTLFYHAKSELYGEHQPGGINVAITGNREDDDLVDLAAVATLQHRGTIRDNSAGELATNSPLAAILRY